MTILSTDTFVRADNGSSWGTSSGGETYSTGRGTPVVSISSNEGLFHVSDATFAIQRLGSQTPTNQEVLVRVKPGNTTDNIGTIARYSSSSNFYYGVLNGGNLVIGKDVSGSFSTLSSAAFTYTNANFYWLRFNLVGTALKLRAWQDGNTEPGTWNVSTTDSSLTSGGYGLATDSANTSSFDSLTVTDAASGVVAPTSTFMLLRVG